MEIDNVKTFPFEILQYVLPCPMPAGNPSFFSKKYADIICTFDIETTALDDIQQSVLWHWQACIDGMLCVGRTWEEYKEFLDKVDQYLPKGICFVQYVHNLSYEFQFLRAIHDFQPDEVFCMTGRKVVKCNIGNRFEFRCSYVLTNMSLRELLNKMHVEHKKTEMDYSVKRYSWTEISKSDMDYCIADVLGLYEALKKMFKSDRSTLQTVPMTSTGYVRTDFKRAMRKGGFLSEVHDCSPSYEVYLMIRRAFRGGDTHANRLYTSVIVGDEDHLISSWDRSSSYPDVICNYPYAIKPWVKQRITKLEQLEDGFPYLLEIKFTNIEVADQFECAPYIPVHKCFELERYIADNGRVLEAKSLIFYCTDIDLQILKDQYKWESAVVLKCFRSEYGMLPEAMREVTLEYYRRKTEWKGLPQYETEYNRAKQKINAVYGMTATNPIRTNLKFNGTDFDIVPMNEEEELRKANKKAFTCYAWGCWVTAWARLQLHRARKLVGNTKFLYCDTDSVKFIGDVDFTELNAELQALSEKHGAYADDPNGVRHYMGVFEQEKSMKRFCSLGAKKYAYEDMDGKLHITIAGVSKEGAEELGKLENFKEGFVFHDSAGMEAVYNDHWHEPVVIDGHTVEIPPNIYLHQSEYTLGLTVDYIDIFKLTQEQYDRIMKTR